MLTTSCRQNSPTGTNSQWAERRDLPEHFNTERNRMFDVPKAMNHVQDLGLTERFDVPFKRSIVALRQEQVPQGPRPPLFLSKTLDRVGDVGQVLEIETVSANRVQQ